MILPEIVERSEALGVGEAGEERNHEALAGLISGRMGVWVGICGCFDGAGSV